MYDVVAYRTMSNKDIAQLVISGKKRFVRAATLRQATAIRVAGHRLGAVLTTQRLKRGFRLVKSDTKITHRKPVKRTAKRPARRTK